MSDEIKLDGIGVAPSVLEAIVTLAAQDVDGVAAVGAPGLAGLAQKARKGTARAVSVCPEGEAGDKLSATVHIQIDYGPKLREVARAVQSAVSDAIRSQVGVDVAGVDVYVDGIVFPEQA